MHQRLRQVREDDPNGEEATEVLRQADAEGKGEGHWDGSGPRAWGIIRGVRTFTFGRVLTDLFDLRSVRTHSFVTTSIVGWGDGQAADLS